ncbi:MFS transporter [Bacillus carboniphilus]|uniref:MFS transporter n=1 Tax=Bacillus carboniphilus TaxID=86663 RepID=A0ABY9JSZ4_9BACI|nr:MFS transporter [Bacillus carboniphilus]WLR41388.1 MFS transporter [Bacillus carboniphilus]
MTFTNFHSSIRIRLIMMFFTTMATMSVLPYLMIFFSTKLGTNVTGIMFLCVIFSIVIGSIAGGFFSDKYGRKKIVLLGESFVFIGFVAVAISNSPWFDLPYVSFILLVFIHLFTGFVTPAYQALIIDASNIENRKAIYTTSYWLNSLATAIGGMIGGFLFKDFYFYLFLFVAFVTLCSVIITFFFIEETFHMKTVTSIKQPITRNQNVQPIFQIISKDKVFTAFAIASPFDCFSGRTVNQCHWNTIK